MKNFKKAVLATAIASRLFAARASADIALPWKYVTKYLMGRSAQYVLIQINIRIC